VEPVREGSEGWIDLEGRRVPLGLAIEDGDI